MELNNRTPFPRPIVLGFTRNREKENGLPISRQAVFNKGEVNLLVQQLVDTG